MAATRQDAWSPDDDLLLAEVTLRYIREGGTQLAAFEEVAERLGRTPAACGFRWNSTVRKKYEAAIAIAKSQRQKKKAGKTLQSQTQAQKAETSLVGSEEAVSGAPISYDAIIQFLQEQKTQLQTLQNQVQLLEAELKKKDEQIQNLREENERIKQEYSSIKTVNEDYNALIQIMERARKLAMLNDEEKPVFRMDSNGNLERVNK